MAGLAKFVRADARRSVVRQLEECVRRYDNAPNRFVMSSRLAGYRSAPLGEPFAHYTVQEMNKTQIHCFLERWCRAVEAVETPDPSPAAREGTARREVDSSIQAGEGAPRGPPRAGNPPLFRVRSPRHPPPPPPPPTPRPHT